MKERVKLENQLDDLLPVLENEHINLNTKHRSSNGMRFSTVCENVGLKQFSHSSLTVTLERASGASCAYAA